MPDGVAVKPVPSLTKTTGSRPWLMLVMVWLAQTVVYVGMQAAGPLAPFIQDELHISRAQVGLFMTAYSAGATLVLLPAGSIADRFAARWLLFLGTGFAGLLMFLASRAGAYWEMFAAIFLAGVGAGLIGPATTKAVMSWFDARTRGTAMGFKQTGTSLGGAIGAAILPPLALAIGWRDALGFSGFGIAVVGLLTYVIYRDFPAPRTGTGMALRASVRALLSKRDLRLTLLSAPCFATIQMSLATYLVLYLKEAGGMAVATGGLLLALAQFSGVASRIVMGISSDRLLGGRRKELLVSCGLGALGATVFIALAGPALPGWAIAALILLLGATAIGWTGIYVTLVAELSGKEMVGVGAALGLGFANAGIFLGPPLFGLIVDMSQSYSAGWSFLALAAAVATLLAASVREGRR